METGSVVMKRNTREERSFMKSIKLTIAVLGGLLFSGALVFGLSREIGRDIEFPKDYDPQKAKAILGVVQDQRFAFTSGIVSYWPPDWGTRLSYTGDAESLNEFLRALRSVQGVGLRVILYHGRDDDLRQDSPWQLDFSHARPDQITVYVNLNAKTLDLAKVKLPEWPPA
jgi:hypothetical protein